MRSSMLHGSETWPVRKENVVTLQRAEMRMVRWMCGVKLKDRLLSKELRQRLDDSIFINKRSYINSATLEIGSCLVGPYSSFSVF